MQTSIEKQYGILDALSLGEMSRKYVNYQVEHDIPKGGVCYRYDEVGDIKDFTGDKYEDLADAFDAIINDKTIIYAIYDSEKEINIRLEVDEDGVMFFVKDNVRFDITPDGLVEISCNGGGSLNRMDVKAEDWVKNADDTYSYTYKKNYRTDCFVKAYEENGNEIVCDSVDTDIQVKVTALNAFNGYFIYSSKVNVEEAEPHLPTLEAVSEMYVPLAGTEADKPVTGQIVSNFGEGSLILSHGLTGKNAYAAIAERTDTERRIMFGIGTGGQNRGIYDSSTTNWMIYRTSANALRLNAINRKEDGTTEEATEAITSDGVFDFYNNSGIASTIKSANGLMVHTGTGVTTFDNNIVLGNGEREIVSDADNNSIRIQGGTAQNHGSRVICFGKDHSRSGQFVCCSSNGIGGYELVGTPDGTLTWGGDGIDNQMHYSTFTFSINNGGYGGFGRSSASTSITFFQPISLCTTNRTWSFSASDYSAYVWLTSHSGKISNEGTISQVKYEPNYHFLVIEVIVPSTENLMPNHVHALRHLTVTCTCILNS